MIRGYTPAGFPIYMLEHLEWELWGVRSNGRVSCVVGREQWHRLQFALTVKPTILESDPGPLDAKVP